MDRLDQLISLPAPALPPRLPKNCPAENEPGYVPKTAVEDGCPTKPSFTDNLDVAERRRRTIIYMVRYNRIDPWMKANILNTGLTKTEFTNQSNWIDRVRREFQSMSVGNTIAEEGTKSWYIQYLLWVISEENFKVHLHNIRHYIRTYEQVPAGESVADQTSRVADLARFVALFDDHKRRWIQSIQDAIDLARASMASTPVYGPANLARIRELREDLDRFQVLKTAAKSYNPISRAPEMGERIPPKLLHYCERSIRIQYEFWKRANIINRDVIASLYGYAEEVIDVRACLENGDMGDLMLRTWVATCIVTAQQVVCPRLSNMAIGQFMGGNQRLYSECRFPTDHQLPYEAFKTAEIGDEKEGGIELVMLRGTTPSAKKKRNSAHLGSAVSGMPKMGRLK